MSDKNNNEDQFISKVCDVLHEAIDREICDIKEDMIEEKREREKNHEEIKKLIEDNYENLRNKIFISEKGVVSKIDTLDEFDSTIRGNGTPGVWESIRSINKNIKYIFCAIAFLLILTLGGSWNDISTKSIKEKILPKKEVKKEHVINTTDVKKVEAPKIKIKQEK